MSQAQQLSWTVHCRLRWGPLDNKLLTVARSPNGLAPSRLSLPLPEDPDRRAIYLCVIPHDTDPWSLHTYNYQFTHTYAHPDRTDSTATA